MAQKITPFLWFDGKAERAANFYASIFKNLKIRYRGLAACRRLLTNQALRVSAA